MTMSLRRHYKSSSKCHGNERLKRKAFRRLRKTVPPSGYAYARATNVDAAAHVGTL